MEVVDGGKDQRLVLLDALDLVSPLAGNLNGSLDGLGAGVHGQDHVVAEHGADLLSPLGEDIIVESARAESETAGLLGDNLDELRVAMALVDGAVGGEEVEVVAALGIPDVDALGTGKNDGQRVVVVGGVLVLGGDGAVGGGGVVAGVVGERGIGGRSGGAISVGCHGGGCVW